MITRRTFLLASASPAVFAAPAEAGKWWLKPVRLFHPNMRESELRGLDMRRFIADCAATNADGMVASAGGVFAFYPSKVRYHTVSRYLDGRDFLKETIEQAHAVGLKVIARVDFSKARAEVLRDHPEWISRRADGSPNRAGSYYRACPNSPFAGEQFAVPVIREILGGYAVDGFHINGGGFAGDCYCASCKEKFGAEIPAAPDWTSAAWRRFIAWRYEATAANFALLQKEMQRTRPDVFWTGELSGLDNARWMRDRAYDIVSLSHSVSSLMSTIDDISPDPDLRWVTGMTTSYARSVGGRPPIINLKTTMRSGGWTHAGMPEAEYAQCAWQALAHGGGLKMATFGIPGNIDDKRNLAVIAETLGVLKKHAWVYEDARPVASVALVWSHRTLELYGRDDPKARYAECALGFYAALVENHIPAMVVSDDWLTPERLEGFRVLVLPNLACMSDGQVAAVRQFVQRGGGLVASYETSLFDQNGVGLGRLAMADLLGAGYDQGTKPPAAARNAYFCRHEAHESVAWIRGTDVLPFGGRIVPVRAAGSGRVPLVFGYNQSVDNPEEIENPVRTDLPLLVANTVGQGRVVYFPCDIDRFYLRSRLPDSRRLLEAAVLWAHRTPPPVRSSAGSAVEVTLSEKPGYLFVHLVNTTGRHPLGEVSPVSRVELSVDLPGRVGDVRTMLGGARLPFRQREGRVDFVLPALGAYEVAVIKWGREAPG